MSEDALPSEVDDLNNQIQPAKQQLEADCERQDDACENGQNAKFMQPHYSKQHVSEQQLQRDKLSITMLVEVYHKPLFRYGYRLTGCTSDAEDLTQQTFLIAHQKLEQLRDCEKVQSWLFTVLRNLFFKATKKNNPPH